MEFKLRIRCDNEAFTDPNAQEDDELAQALAAAAEVARILRHVAGGIDEDALEVGDGWSIFDVNGNKVGAVEVCE